MESLTLVGPRQYELNDDEAVWVLSHDISVLISEGPHELTVEVFRRGHENNPPVDTTRVSYKKKGAYAL